MKLADFGCACEQDNQVYVGVGTTGYKAPEIVTYKAYTCKADIWSFGRTIVEMATRRTPFSFHDLRSQEIKDLTAINCQLRVHRMDLPLSAHDLIQICQEPDPTKRPSASDLLQHEFMLSHGASAAELAQCVKDTQRHIEDDTETSRCPLVTTEITYPL